MALKRLGLVTFGVAAVWSLGTARAAGDGCRTELQRSFALTSGGKLSLETVNGAIEIFGWDRDTVEVEAATYGETQSQCDAMSVAFESSPNSLRIRLQRPPRKGAGARFAMRVPMRVHLEKIVTTNGSIVVNDIQGTVRLKTTNSAVTVERIQGPLDVLTSNASVQLRQIDGPSVVRTSNGRVLAEDVRGTFEAFTSKGSIMAHIATSEPRRMVRLETTEGSIDLSLDQMPVENEIRASTKNAGITVRLPETASARVKAQTSNAPVSTDFDVSQESSSKGKLDATIGRGGSTLDLATTNATIQVVKQ
jgi:hypothetical protein